jgi:hypothetical protein
MRNLRANIALLSLVVLLETGFALAQAPVTAGRPPDVIFVPTPDDVVDEMLSLAKVGPRRSL